MAAVGLLPEHRIENPNDEVFYISTLVEFVFAMQERLLAINENSYNNFMLRVGVNVGNVVAGVIGARKPQYDIWGNTVNVASRMESTGLAGHVQISEETYLVLKNCPYEMHCRGTVNVKGKGKMTTYLLVGRKQSTTMRIDEVQPRKQGNMNMNGFFLQNQGISSSVEIPTQNNIQNFCRNFNEQGGGLSNMEQGGVERDHNGENEPLLPPPPLPLRNITDVELGWPRIAKVYPSEREKRSAPVKRTHSDRVTSHKDVRQIGIN